MNNELKQEFSKIQIDLLYHKYLYYDLEKPEISDYEYDMLEKRSFKLAQKLGFRADSWLGPEVEEKLHVHWMVGFDVKNIYWTDVVKEYNLIEKHEAYLKKKLEKLRAEMGTEPEKIEGYWWSKYETEYPKPIPYVLTDIAAKVIYNLILEKEKEAKVIRYRGFSRSRITGERLGSTEYWTDEWLWPEDFAKHYVLDHRVKPSSEFLKYIRYE